MTAPYTDAELVDQQGRFDGTRRAVRPAMTSINGRFASRISFEPTDVEELAPPPPPPPPPARLEVADGFESGPAPRAQAKPLRLADEVAQPPAASLAKPLRIADDVAEPAPASLAKPLRIAAPEGDAFDAVAVAKPKPAPAAQANLNNFAEVAPGPYKAQCLADAGIAPELIAKLDAGGIDDAFSQLVKAQGRPTTLSLAVHTTQKQLVGGGDGEQVQEVDMPVVQQQAVKTTKAVTFSVAAAEDAHVTATLLEDDVARETARSLGVPDDAMAMMNGTQVRDVVASALMASKTPGPKTLSFIANELRNVSDSSDSSHLEMFEQRGTFSFNVTKSGDILAGGKPLSTVATLKVSQQVEKLSEEDKRTELIALGFPPERMNASNNEDLHRALTKISVELGKPNPGEITVTLDRDDYRVTPRKGADGKLEGVDVVQVPKQKKQGVFGKIAGAVLTVLSFIPATAVFARIGQAALAVYNGVKSKNPLGIIGGLAGAVTGAVGAFGNQVFGAATETVANVAGRISDFAGTVGTAIQAVRGKDPGAILGFLSGIAGTAADFVKDSAGGLSETLRGVSNTARQAQTVVGAAQAVRNRDLGGILGAASGLVGSLGSSGQTEATDDTFESRGNDGESIGNTEGSDGPSGVSTSAVSGAEEPEEVPREQVTVRRGDSLTRIARESIGDVARLPELYAWNAQRVGVDPNKLQPGQELELPPADFRLSPQERADFYALAHIPPPPGAQVADEPDFTDVTSGASSLATAAARAQARMPDEATLSQLDNLKQAATEIMSAEQLALKLGRGPGKVVDATERILTSARELILAKNFGGLATMLDEAETLNALMKGPHIIDDIEAASRASKIATTLGALKTLANKLKPVEIGVNAGAAFLDDTAQTLGGRTANALYSILTDNVLGNIESGVYRAVDTVTGLAGLGSEGSTAAFVGSLSPKNNIKALGQNAIALLEISVTAAFGGDIDAAMDAIVKKNRAGGAIGVQALTNLGSRLGLGLYDLQESITDVLKKARGG